jgi:hypothetical protein
MWVTRPRWILPRLMAELEGVRVECYSGHMYAQEPRAFAWQGRRYAVVEVEARWRLPQGPAFRVRTGPEERCELHYNEADDRWTIVHSADTNHNDGQGGP